MIRDAIEIITATDTTSRVGYYADVDYDGEVDGVIYADLAVGNTNESGYWSPGSTGSRDITNGTYTIPTETNLKNYVISQSSYSGSFGTMPVIAPYGTEGTKDRFYVMALSNLDNDTTTRHYWYYSAGATSPYMSDYSSICTSTASITSTMFASARLSDFERN